MKKPIYISVAPGTSPLSEAPPEEVSKRLNAAGIILIWQTGASITVTTGPSPTITT